MSILRILQNYLAEYGQMDFKQVVSEEINGMTTYRILDIQTDITAESPQSYALSPSGNNTIKTDILGNRTYENNYVFYAKEHSQNEIDRQDTHDFLQDFQSWLETRVDSGDLPVFPAPYKAENIEVAHSMLFDIFEDGTGLYQVQIKVILKKIKESEDI